MAITTDPTTPCLREHRAGGQQECYLVLSDEEIAKGYVQPVRLKYVHIKCGTETRMPEKCAETYAHDPEFYGGTFCVGCSSHFPLRIGSEWQFRWSGHHPGAPEYVGQPVKTPK